MPLSDQSLNLLYLMPNLSCAIIGLLIFKSRDIYVAIFRIGLPLRTKWQPVFCFMPQDCRVMAIQRVQSGKT